MPSLTVNGVWVRIDPASFAVGPLRRGGRVSMVSLDDNSLVARASLPGDGDGGDDDNVLRLSHHLSSICWGMSAERPIDAIKLRNGARLSFRLPAGTQCAWTTRDAPLRIDVFGGRVPSRIPRARVAPRGVEVVHHRPPAPIAPGRGAGQRRTSLVTIVDNRTADRDDIVIVHGDGGDGERDHAQDDDAGVESLSLPTLRIAILAALLRSSIEQSMEPVDDSDVPDPLDRLRRRLADRVQRLHRLNTAKGGLRDDNAAIGEWAQREHPVLFERLDAAGQADAARVAVDGARARIAALPRLTSPAATAAADDGGGEQCHICMDAAVELTICDRCNDGRTCETCLDRLVGEDHDACPYCRAPLLTRVRWL